MSRAPVEQPLRHNEPASRVTSPSWLQWFQQIVTDQHVADTTIHHAPAAAAANTSVTATGTAGATYTSTEQAMIDALVADVATLNTALNELKAKLRVPGTLAT